MKYYFFDLNDFNFFNFRGNTFDERILSPGIFRLSEDLLTATLIGDGENNLIQGKVKMIPTSKAAFFEIAILSEAENGFVEIGLISPPTYAGSNDVESLPMKTKSFYRYSSLGRLEGGTSDSENCAYGSPFRRGDVVGCALNEKQEIRNFSQEKKGNLFF